jgi:hypothetical protein
VIQLSLFSLSLSLALSSWDAEVFTATFCHDEVGSVRVIYLRLRTSFQRMKSRAPKVENSTTLGIAGCRSVMQRCPSTISVSIRTSKIAIGHPMGKYPRTNRTMSVYHKFSPVIHENLALVTNSKLSPNELNLHLWRAVLRGRPYRSLLFTCMLVAGGARLQTCELNEWRDVPWLCHLILSASHQRPAVLKSNHQSNPRLAGDEE